jgi:hypothetical protein
MTQKIRYYRVRQDSGPTGQPLENMVIADSANRIPAGQAGATPGLWDDCLIGPSLYDPSYAIGYESNFLGTTPATSVIPGWTTTIATSGSVTTSATGGGLIVSAGAVTAGQGINLQMIATAFTPTANKPIWLEGSLKFTGLSATPKVQFLFGLAAAGTTLVTGNAVGTEDKAAFAGVSTTGVILRNTTLSTTATTGTGFTVVDTTTYKLGMKVTTTSVDFWLNGTLLGTSITNIPAAALAPSLVVQGNATVTSVVTLQWLKVFQPR